MRGEGGVEKIRWEDIRDVEVETNGGKQEQNTQLNTSRREEGERGGEWNGEGQK